MSQPNGLLVLGDHLFLNYIFFGGGQRGLINTAGIINPNLTLNGFNCNEKKGKINH